MLSCEEVSRLVSESLDGDLPLWQRLNLRLHLAMCRLCNGFAREIKRLRHAAEQHAQEIENDTALSDIKLTPEARARMESAIRELGS